MELVYVNRDNIDKEHICCALSGTEMNMKKEWLKQRFDDGLVFLKCNVRGKCFIEYMPAENAWVPISADGYMYIDCLWVSGQFKGHGYSNLLLDECIRDSKEKGFKGLCVLSSDKKRGFLSDPKYLAYKGFKIGDTYSYFTLMYLPFEEAYSKPAFKECIRHESFDDMGSGFTLYYTDQCPFTIKYVPLLKSFAQEKQIPLNVVHIDTVALAQSTPCPFTTFSLFYNGKLVTHEVQSEKKLEELYLKLEEK